MTDQLCPDCDLDPCGCPPKCIHGEFIFGDRIKCAGCDELTALRQRIYDLENGASMNEEDVRKWNAMVVENGLQAQRIAALEAGLKECDAALDLALSQSSTGLTYKRKLVALAARSTARTLLQEPMA